MKKSLSLVFAFYVLCVFSIHSESLSPKAQFTKGNVASKTALVKKYAGHPTENLSEYGIKFVVENKDILENDKDLCALAVASVSALPRKYVTTANVLLVEHLISIFYAFDDVNLRIAVLDKILGDENIPNKTETVINFINNYLKNTVEKKEKVTDASRAALKQAGVIGNKNTFRIVFNGWKLQTWKNFKEDAETAVVKLAVLNMGEVKQVFSMSNYADDLQFFNLIEKNTQISKEFKAEVAENALSDTILSIENVESISRNQVELLLKSLKMISEAKWTRAASLVLRTFELAKEEYAKKTINSDQFISIIDATASLASPETAGAFSKYLETLNLNFEKGVAPEKAVVLSIIKSLGELGDKTAFDNLLYVAYLPYPEDVIAQARNSLARLQW